jgi:hypothetical protein
MNCRRQCHICIHHKHVNPILSRLWCDILQASMFSANALARHMINNKANTANHKSEGRSAIGDRSLGSSRGHLGTFGENAGAAHGALPKGHERHGQQHDSKELNAHGERIFSLQVKPCAEASGAVRSIHKGGPSEGRKGPIKMQVGGARAQGGQQGGRLGGLLDDILG